MARIPALLVLLALTLPLLCCGPREAPSADDPTVDDREFIEDKASTYALAARGPTTMRFVDVSATSGITAVNHSGRAGVKEYLAEAVGTGPSWLDYDNDGFLDVYIPDGDVFSNYVLRQETDAESGRLVPRLVAKDPRPEAFHDQLWRNRGDGSFENVAAAAGVQDERWSYGSTAFDYDGDGWTDIFVANFGSNRLYRNNGDGTFTDIAPGVGLDDHPEHWSNCAAVGDIDGDQRLDIYLTNFSNTAAEVERLRYEADLPVGTPVETISGRGCQWKGIPAYCGPVGLEAQDDQLYVQQADGTFRDVTRLVGLTPSQPRYGFTALMYDYNEDGLLDVYIANDSVENFMWQQERADGKIHFREVADVLGVKFARSLRPQASMGAAVADINQDGLFDLFVTNFSHDYNNIFLGQRAVGGRESFFFKDRGLQVMGQQVYYDLSWGCGWVDFDNDGDLDLYVANGHVYKEIDLFEKTGATYEQYNTLVECLDAPSMEFREIGAKAIEGAPESLPEGHVRNLDAGPGMAVQWCTRGAGFADFDNDGRVDILLQNMNEAPTLLRNESATGPNHQWIKIVLRQEGANRDALGAVVQVTAGGVSQTFPVIRATSLMGTNDPRLHVGLGAESRCDVRVIWPGREATTDYAGLEAGGLWELDRASGEARPLPHPSFGG
ncbi:MAG: CRTAC1 family protein [Planctomycetota bacterium]